MKRPCTEYDVPSTHDLASYYARDDDRSAHQVIWDTDSINASYQMLSYGGGESAGSIGSGVGGRAVDDRHVVAIGGPDAGVSRKDRSIAVGGGRPEIPLPPNASSTLFVEGLPANWTRREVSRYKFDQHDHDLVQLRLQFARHPGARSGGGHRGKR